MPGPPFAALTAVIALPMVFPPSKTRHEPLRNYRLPCGGASEFLRDSEEKVEFVFYETCLKGTMSEFEVSLFRQRAREAFERKIRSGHAMWEMPVGFVRTEEHRVEKIADRHCRQP